MATAFTHAFFAVTFGKMCFPRRRTLRFWAVAILGSILPDLDIYSFPLGFPYGHFLGHRGFSHSLFFAFLLSLTVVGFIFRGEAPFSKSWWKWTAFFFLLTSSHGLLDAMTDGGLGVAFFSPFSQTRYFLPWRPLRVSPIGLEGFFSPWGREVILSEIAWVGAPSLCLLALIWIARRFFSRRNMSGQFMGRNSDFHHGGEKSALRALLTKGVFQKMTELEGEAKKWLRERKA